MLPFLREDFRIWHMHRFLLCGLMVSKGRNVRFNGLKARLQFFSVIVEFTVLANGVDHNSSFIVLV
jgi:hypothetical protein